MTRGGEPPRLLGDPGWSRVQFVCRLFDRGGGH
jgi:hypothetical protein